MKQNTFNAFVKVTVELDVELKAETFEQALEQAKKLEASKLLKWKDPCNDYSIKVTAILGEEKD